MDEKKKPLSEPSEPRRIIVGDTYRHASTSTEVQVVDVFLHSSGKNWVRFNPSIPGHVFGESAPQESRPHEEFRKVFEYVPESREKKLEFWDMFKKNDEVKVTESQTMRIIGDGDEEGKIKVEEMGTGAITQEDATDLIEVKKVHELGIIPGVRVLLEGEEGTVLETRFKYVEIMMDDGITMTIVVENEQSLVDAALSVIEEGGEKMEVKLGHSYKHTETGTVVEVTETAEAAGVDFVRIDPGVDVGGESVSHFTLDVFKENFTEHESKEVIPIELGSEYVLEDGQRISVDRIYENSSGEIRVRIANDKGIHTNRSLKDIRSAVVSRIEGTEHKEKGMTINVRDKYTLHGGAVVRISEVRLDGAVRIIKYKHEDGVTFGKTKEDFEELIDKKIEGWSGDELIECKGVKVDGKYTEISTGEVVKVIYIHKNGGGTVQLVLLTADEETRPCLLDDVFDDKYEANASPEEYEIHIGDEYILEDGSKVTIERFDKNGHGEKLVVYETDGRERFSQRIDEFTKRIEAKVRKESEEGEINLEVGKKYRSKFTHEEITITSIEDDGASDSLIRFTPKTSIDIGDGSLRGDVVTKDQFKENFEEIPGEESVNKKFRKLFKEGDIIKLDGEEYEILAIDDTDDEVLLEHKPDRIGFSKTKQEIMDSMEGELQKKEAKDALANAEIQVGTKIQLTKKGGVAVEVIAVDEESGIFEVLYPNDKVKSIDVMDADEMSGLGIQVLSQPTEPMSAAEQSALEREGNLIRNVTFTEREVKGRRGKVRRVYTSPGIPGKRKAIELSHKSRMPEPGTPYLVHVVRDTNEDDPSKGKMIVRIVEEDVMAGFKKKKEVRYERVKNPPPAVEINTQTGEVYIGDTVIRMAEQKGVLTPPRSRFETYTLDERTLGVLEFVATSVQLGQPCLLTGETATSKTSAIEYLASISGHEIVRMNLGGQTDTSDLIGKYVPNDGKMQIKLEQLLKDPEKISQQSRDIIYALQAEIQETGVARGLNKLESQKIADYENLDISDWRWQDGKVLEAMRRGAWLILDEINAADNAVRTRLNSLLENPPSLTVSEHEGEVFRLLSAEEQEMHESGSLPGVEPIKSGYHAFGTQNPGGYKGRKAMEKDERRRWPRRLTVHEPDADQYAADLEHMVFGRQPDIMSDGRVKFKGGKPRELSESAARKTPTYLDESDLVRGHEAFTVLKDTPNIESFLRKMSIFHAKIAEMAKNREISKGKDAEIFTRTSLHAFITYLSSVVLIDRAWRPPKRISFKDNAEALVMKGLEQYYFGKMTNADDRTKVELQLTGVGILDANGKMAFKFEE